MLSDYISASVEKALSRNRKRDPLLWWHGLKGGRIVLDGTEATYRKEMRRWFLSHGANVVSSEGLTGLVDLWYQLTRDSWDGGVTFAQPDASGDTGSSYGTKIGDNVGLVCVPSTDTDENQDDYKGLPLFAITLCNWELDATDGHPIITAIKDITSSYEQDNPEKYVGVLQMAGCTWRESNADSYTYGYTANRNANHSNLRPVPESINSDGTIRNYVLHGKYMSKTVNGKMTCCSGLVPTAWQSHNSLITLSAANGAMYSGGTVIDWSWLWLMSCIKYGSMTQDGLNQGCVSYDYQKYAAAGETDTHRILLTPADGGSYLVGSSVLIGVYNGSSKDRGTAANYSISGREGRIITAKETITVDGVNYTALTVDGDPFDTAGDGTATSGNTIVSTFHWPSGSCDHVRGYDGAPASPGSGRYAAMIQGIEYSVGAYEVFSDVILQIADGVYTPYLARRRADQATGITANMRASSLVSSQPASNSWEYIRKMDYDGELFFGTDTTGGSSTKYVRDGFYKNGTGTTNATREWLAFGFLFIGPGGGGLSALNGTTALSPANWNLAGRLSPNGNRGELAA